MVDNNLEISKRDCYWSNNPRISFSRIIYKNCIQREGQFKEGCRPTTNRDNSNSETNDAK